MPKLKALFIKCPKATIPIFPTLENHHIFKITFFGLLTISRSILTPQTPTIYQKNGNYLRIQQKFSDLSYEVYARRYKLPNISHFFRTTPYVLTLLWTRQKFVLLYVARKLTFDIADLLLTARKQPLFTSKTFRYFAALVFTSI